MLSLRNLRGLRKFQRFLSSKVVENKKEETVPPAWTAPPPDKDVQATDDEGRTASLVGNFFSGKFDTAALTFPEVTESKERHEWLHSVLSPVQNFFNEQVETRTIDTESQIPDHVLKGLKVFGLFGKQVPIELGGMGLNTSENARLTEILGENTSVGRLLSSHNCLAIKGLLLCGSDDQKKKYLPRLASGEMIAGFCLSELYGGSDNNSMKTHGNLTTDGTSWTISGSKMMVTNADIADFFLVLAKTAPDSVSLASSKRISAFIVEKKFGRITIDKPRDTLGARGSRICDVHFDKTPVPMENMIGGIGDGHSFLTQVFNYGRITSASMALGQLKKVIGLATQHCMNREQFGKPLSEFNLIQGKLAEMTKTAYVMESLIYFTAGLMDLETYADTTIETAITKIYCSEGCWQGANDCLQLFGGAGYMKDSPIELVLRDARLNLLVDQTNDILRLYIGSLGLQYCGQVLHDTVRKGRNPLQFPEFALKKYFQRHKQLYNINKLTLRLQEYLHPTLLSSANLLENCLQHLKFATEILLTRRGAEVVLAQYDLERLAQIAIDMYAMTCVLSRASRSYCIGLRNAEFEINIAEVFCLEASERIKIKANDICKGQYETPDHMFTRLSEEMLKNKGYPLTHPLERTFW